MGSNAFLNTRFAKNLSEGLHAAKGTVTSACERALKSNEGFLRLGKPADFITDAETKGFRGVRGSNSSAGLELKNSIRLEGRTYQYRRNLEQNIDGRIYSGHALDQMQNRGIPLTVVKNAIEKGEKIEAKRNCLEYIDAVNHVSVVTAKDTGNVITVKWRK